MPGLTKKIEHLIVLFLPPVRAPAADVSAAPVMVATQEATINVGPSATAETDIEVMTEEGASTARDTKIPSQVNSDTPTVPAAEEVEPAGTVCSKHVTYSFYLIN